MQSGVIASVRSAPSTPDREVALDDHVAPTPEAASVVPHFGHGTDNEMVGEAPSRPPPG